MILPGEISCAAAKWQSHLFLIVSYLIEDTALVMGRILNRLKYYLFN